MCVTPDLLISRAAMVHNHWCVGFRLQSVTCTTYAWSQRDGDHTRGLRRHTECAFSYGSGAWGQGGSSDPWSGYRGDDAQDGMQNQIALHEYMLVETAVIVVFAVDNML